MLHVSPSTSWPLPYSIATDFTDPTFGIFEVLDSTGGIFLENEFIDLTQSVTVQIKISDTVSGLLLTMIAPMLAERSAASA